MHWIEGKKIDHAACDAMMAAGAAALDRETIRLLGREMRWEPELHHEMYIKAAWLEPDACVERICATLGNLSCFWSAVAGRHFPLFCAFATARRTDYEHQDLPPSAHFLPAGTLAFDRLVLDEAGTLRLYATRGSTSVLDDYRESARAWMDARGMVVHNPDMLTVILGRFQGVRMWDRDGDFEGDFRSLREHEHQAPVFTRFIETVRAWDTILREQPVELRIREVFHERLSDLLHHPFGNLLAGPVRRVFFR